MKGLELKVLGNLPWDTFLKTVVVDSKLSPAERDCFLARFCEAHLQEFQDAQSIEEAVRRLLPDYNLDTYKKHFTNIYAKLKVTVSECQTHHKKDQELCHALKRKFEHYRASISPNIRLERQMANALQLLDYEAQEKQFSKFVRSRQVAGAFVVQVSGDDDDLLLQRWLAQRLTRFLGCGQGELPEFISAIKITKAWQQDEGWEFFWNALGRSLKLSSPFNSDDVIRALYQRCQTKTVVITLHELSLLGSKQPAFLKEFWSPICKTLVQEPNRAKRSRLILLMTRRDKKTELVGYEHLVVLDSLEAITKSDIESWLEDDRLCQLINRCRDELRSPDLERLTSPDARDEWDYPSEALEEICQAFGFEQGLTTIEQYWKLNEEVTVAA